MYPVHTKPAAARSFDRLNMLWERYPQYHDFTVFSTLDTLLEEHGSYSEEFDDALREENIDTVVTRGMDIASAVGFGGSVYLFLLAPLVLLFSYTRKPKYPWIGMLVPVAGFALIFVAYVEGIHQILYLLPVEKVTLDELREMLMVGTSMIQ